MGIAAGNVHFTYSQLMGIWEQAGGPPPSAALAAAVAMAESRGNSAAYNMDSNGSIDRGLWQINSVWGSRSSYDVMTNARAAVFISNQGKNWTPWTTYTSGAYRQFLQSGVTASNNVPINATNAAANQPQSAGLTSANQQAQETNVFCFPGQPFPTLLCPSPDNPAAKVFESIIYAILKPIITLIAGVIGMTSGGTLMLIGMFLIFESTKTGQQITQGGLQIASMFAGPEAGAATAGATAGERTALIRQQTASQTAAARQELAQQTAAARAQPARETSGERTARIRQQTQRERIAARQQTTRTRVTRRTEGGTTTYTTTREAINGQANEYRYR